MIDTLHPSRRVACVVIAAGLLAACDCRPTDPSPPSNPKPHKPKTGMGQTASVRHAVAARPAG